MPNLLGVSVSRGCWIKSWMKPRERNSGICGGFDQHVPGRSRCDSGLRPGSGVVPEGCWAGRPHGRGQPRPHVRASCGPSLFCSSASVTSPLRKRGTPPGSHRVPPPLQPQLADRPPRLPVSLSRPKTSSGGGCRRHFHNGRTVQGIRAETPARASVHYWALSRNL